MIERVKWFCILWTFLEQNTGKHSLNVNRDEHKLTSIGPLGRDKVEFMGLDMLF